MLLGVMSDSHDRLDVLRRAVELLNRRGAEHVLHAGDVVSPFAAAELGRLKAPVTAVFGNNDGERRLLAEKLPGIAEFAELTLGGTKVALYHGTSPELVRALVDSGSYGLVVTGHTHRVHEERRGSTLWLNPGELCGYLTGRCTLALVELEGMQVEVVEL